MNYTAPKDNAKSFPALTGLRAAQFSLLLPYFEASHDDYLSGYEMSGKLRSHRRSFCIYRNSPLLNLPDRLFFILLYLKIIRFRNVMPPASVWTKNIVNLNRRRTKTNLRKLYY